MTPTPNGHGLGQIPDSRDPRDYIYQASARVTAALPPMVDLRPDMPQVVDQLALGSCTSQAIAGAVEHLQRMEHLATWAPSRLFIYHEERVLEGTVPDDAGAMIRDGMKVVHHQGVPPEALWPYDIAKFAEQPPASVYTAAAANIVTAYHRVPRVLSQMLGCLAEGFPIVCGFTVYESFESDVVARTGVVPMPKRGEAVLGGHAVLCCGYDTTTHRFLVRNSWSAAWGQEGYCTIPFRYLTGRLASDFWTMRQIEGTAQG